MSDLFYKAIFALGWPAFATSSKVIHLHRERAKRDGAYILASNHFSPFDVPGLIRATPRLLDFVSVTEVYENKFAAWAYTSLNAFPLDRNRPDAPTVRIILDRLARGRVVAMFPEGGLRNENNSVCLGGTMKPGVARIARMAAVPVIPAVVIGTGAYWKFVSWLPLRRVRYGVIFGEPIFPKSDLAEAEADAAMLQEIREAFKSLYAELNEQLKKV